MFLTSTFDVKNTSSGAHMPVAPDDFRDPRIAACVASQVTRSKLDIASIVPSTLDPWRRRPSSSDIHGLGPLSCTTAATRIVFSLRSWMAMCRLRALLCKARKSYVTAFHQRLLGSCTSGRHPAHPHLFRRSSLYISPTWDSLPGVAPLSSGSRHTEHIFVPVWYRHYPQLS
ncbi:hypothetical protein BD309DRAFT_529090 [Dichomitus squalens]|uniref:Uncharacterized protein n=1 Tax=Dichomitus squalens TaxID=114155 RepID=A0A4Q9Q750_9APHY|nr:hypothetical protein BD309DRAFT_529090 [Dichomitus squalens]TBU63205.1 hypothetical protein BD310DRAFT_621905 [Dichomitus squalens]